MSDKMVNDKVSMAAADSDAQLPHLSEDTGNAADDMTGPLHDMSERVLEAARTMEAELIHALAADQLFLEYQPIFDTDSRCVRAVDALIRWRRPGGEVVRPDLFIPIAEQSHLIVDIGRCHAPFRHPAPAAREVCHA
jgi:predicted signal transduction protein with EAL and GGDEF domain